MSDNNEKFPPASKYASDLERLFARWSEKMSAEEEEGKEYIKQLYGPLVMTKYYVPGLKDEDENGNKRFAVLSYYTTRESDGKIVRSLPVFTDLRYAVLNQDKLRMTPAEDSRVWDGETYLAFDFLHLVPLLNHNPGGVIFNPFNGDTAVHMSRGQYEWWYRLILSNMDPKIRPKYQQMLEESKDDTIRKLFNHYPDYNYLSSYGRFVFYEAMHNGMGQMTFVGLNGRIEGIMLMTKDQKDALLSNSWKDNINTFFEKSGGRDFILGTDGKGYNLIGNKEGYFITNGEQRYPVDSDRAFEVMAYFPYTLDDSDAVNNKVRLPLEATIDKFTDGFKAVEKLASEVVNG